MAAGGLLGLIRIAFSPTEAREMRFYRSLLRVVIALATLVTIIILVITWQDYSAMRSALSMHTYRVVTGQVTDFVPEGPNGHPMEQFTVSGSRYVYASSDITSAFHQTARNGGPLHEGVLVRIADSHGAIVRLEMAR